MKKQPSYQAYLLRCWQESFDNKETLIWRFTLEGARDGQRRGFADLQALYAHLQQLTQAGNGTDATGVPQGVNYVRKSNR